MQCQRCGCETRGTREGDTEYCTSCGGVLGSAFTLAEPFPANVAAVLDRAVAALPAAHELDSNGRFVRGTWQGMTVEEVLRERDAYNRACGE